MASQGPGTSQIYKETTVPLAVQPKNVIDTTEVSTPYSKKKQVRRRNSLHFCPITCHGGIVVSVFTSRSEGRGFESRRRWCI